jgi:hypothetical protein
VNDYTPLRFVDRQAILDAESDEFFARQSSGEFDRERIKAWARIEQMCAERPEPDHTEARRRADEAVRDLAKGLIR